MGGGEALCREFTEISEKNADLDLLKRALKLIVGSLELAYGRRVQVGYDGPAPQLSTECRGWVSFLPRATGAIPTKYWHREFAVATLYF